MTKESVKLLKLRLDGIDISESIYPIYMPDEFKEFKKEVLSINGDKEKYFAKVSEIGAGLIENFPSILDFDLSYDALEGKVPWLYVLNKEIDMEYLGNKMIHLLTNKIKTKGEEAEDFLLLESCENLWCALENLTFGERLTQNEIIGRKRLVEGIMSHRLANVEFIRLEMKKIMKRKRKDLGKYYMSEDDKQEIYDELSKINSMLDDNLKKKIDADCSKIDTLLPEELKSLLDMSKFNLERFLPEELNNAIKKDWKLLESLVKEVSFYSCFENNKHVAISQPITHNPEVEKPVYSSYVISFSLEQPPLSNTSYLYVFVSRRVWLKGKMLEAIKKKIRRRHSLYIYSGNKTVSRYMFKCKKTKENKKQNDTKENKYILEIENKVERELLERKNIDINDIANNPTKYQSKDMSRFIAVPYDAQVFSSRPRHAGIGNMEKLALMHGICDSLNLTAVDEMDLHTIPRVKSNEYISLDLNKDVNIQVWELTNTFFDDIENALHELKREALKKKSSDKVFYFLGDIIREGDLIKTTLILHKKEVKLTFTRHCSTDFSVINREFDNDIDIYNIVQSKLEEIALEEKIHVALVELEDLSNKKELDPKEIIKSALLDKGVPVQMIAPMKKTEDSHVEDVSRIAASLCDLLLNIGLKRVNECINNCIQTYSFKEYKVKVPKNITNLSANEDLNKNLTISIPVVLKSYDGRTEYKILDDNSSWVNHLSELYKKIDKYINDALGDMNKHLNKTTGLKNFNSILEFVIDDNSLDNSQRKILICDYGSEREGFNDLYEKYISVYENKARVKGVELIFTKNNNTTPQFVTVCKKEYAYEHNDNKLKLEELSSIETTNSAGYVKFSDKLVYLIGNKPDTHTPNKANNSFEHNKIEARRRILELVYLGPYDIEEIAKWYQLNRCLHVGYTVMTNKHMDGHILEKAKELIEITEYRYRNIFGKEDVEYDDVFTEVVLGDIDREVDHINTSNRLLDNLFEIPYETEQLSFYL